MQRIKAGEQKYWRLFGRFSVALLLSATLLNAESFEDFKRNQAESFQNFKDERDRAFNKYLKEEWKAYQAAQGIAVYEKPKPKTIPEVKPKQVKPEGPKTIIKIKKVKILQPELPQEVLAQPVVQKVEVPKEVVQKVLTQKEEVPKQEKQSQPQIAKKDINFDFFGVNLGFDIAKNLKKSQFEPKNQKGIGNFFTQAAQSDYESLVKDIEVVTNALNLNDWGVYLLVNEISHQVYSDTDDAKLLSWFLFNKLGYSVKIGLANKHVVLMYYSKKIIYSTPNYSFGKKKYYVIANYAKGRVGRLYSYKQDYPDATKPLNLSLETLPVLESDMQSKHLEFKHLGKKYKFSYKYNKNLIDFMATYPQADYETFFNAPLEPVTYQEIAKSLKKYVDGMKISEAMNFVLNFVQNAFDYERDDEQFGREKVMFAEETLYYDKSDCEDRAVLYSYLIKELFAIKVIGVKYKDHMATALYVPLSGDSVKKGSKKYIIADPTYINANIGESMPKYKSIQPDSFIVVRR